MTDTERAAALAEAIENGWKPGSGKPFISFSDEVLIVAALRAFSPPPADVREDVARMIEVTADICTDFASPYIDNPHQCADAVLSALQAAGWGPRAETTTERRVRHVKRGTTYRVVGEAEAQVSTGRTCCSSGIDGFDTWHARDITDGSLLIIYQSEDDGKLWVRFTDEFEDGRFVQIERIDRAKKGGAG